MINTLSNYLFGELMKNVILIVALFFTSCTYAKTSFENCLSNLDNFQKSDSSLNGEAYYSMLTDEFVFKSIGIEYINEGGYYEMLDELPIIITSTQRLGDFIINGAKVDDGKSEDTNVLSIFSIKNKEMIYSLNLELDEAKAIFGNCITKVEIFNGIFEK